MKIIRFNESDEFNISPERVEDIIEDMNSILTSLSDDVKKVDSYLNELNNYKSLRTKGNDQIDDSISSFQIVRKDLNNSIDKIDNVINNLINYNEEGRKYLYSE